MSYRDRPLIQVKPRDARPFPVGGLCAICELAPDCPLECPQDDRKSVVYCPSFVERFDPPTLSTRWSLVSLVLTSAAIAAYVVVAYWLGVLE